MSRVLFISEDTAVWERIKTFLGEDAFEVTQTGWRDWDVKALSGHAADMFLFDYRNPGSIPSGVSGLLAATIQEHNPHTPVVFVADFDPMLREMIQAAVGKRNVVFADTKTFVDVNRIREVLTTFVSRRDSGKEKENIRAFPRLFPTLRNPKTGRLDAKRVSVLFAIPISRLASSLEVDSAAVYKTPDSAALQAKLLVYERIAKSLLSLVGSEEGLRIWLNAPEVELDNEVPLALLLNGEGEVVADLLEDMQDGQTG